MDNVIATALFIYGRLLLLAGFVGMWWAAVWINEQFLGWNYAAVCVFLIVHFVITLMYCLAERESENKHES